MTDEDLGRLHYLLDSVADLRQRPAPTLRAKSFFCEMLSGYPYELLEKAVYAHMASEAGTYTSPLQPAHIIAQITAMQERDGRPNGDEAWAIALASFDEQATVVWTDEIAAAKAFVCDVYQSGDAVGARMAFRSAYKRHVDNARTTGVAVNWTPSLGHDPELQTAALTAALHGGLLPAPHAQALLPAPESGPALEDTYAREQCKAIKQMIANAAQRRRMEQSSLETTDMDHESRLQAQFGEHTTRDARRTDTTFFATN